MRNDDGSSCSRRAGAHEHGDFYRVGRRGATFTGFGHATFGYFDQSKKDYDRHEARDVEVANVRGSIAWEDARSLHAHAIAAGRDFTAEGGHLLALQVGKGSLELEIVRQPVRLERKRDDALGANVLELP